MDVELGAEQKRRPIVEQPFEHFERCGRVRPRLRMTDGNLAAIGEARFEPRCGPPVDDADGQSLPQSKIRAVDANDTRAENDDVEFLTSHLRPQRLYAHREAARHGPPLSLA